MAPTCAMADGFATAFMVMGLDSAKAVLQKHKELQAYVILSSVSGKYDIWCTPDFSKLLSDNE